MARSVVDYMLVPIASYASVKSFTVSPYSADLFGTDHNLMYLESVSTHVRHHCPTRVTYTLTSRIGRSQVPEHIIILVDDIGTQISTFQLFFKKYFRFFWLVWGILKFQVPFCVFSNFVAEMGNKKSKKTLQTAKADSDPESSEQEVEEKWLKWLRLSCILHHPPSSHCAWPVENKRRFKREGRRMKASQGRFCSGSGPPWVLLRPLDTTKSMEYILSFFWISFFLKSACAYFCNGRKVKACKEFSEFDCNAGLFCQQFVSRDGLDYSDPELPHFNTRHLDAHMKALHSSSSSRPRPPPPPWRWTTYSFLVSQSFFANLNLWWRRFPTQSS